MKGSAMVAENDVARTQLSLKAMMAEYERALIGQALVACSGHQRRAAALLGILPTTLHEKMKRLGIPTRTGLLRELHRSGSTICMVTHDPRFARHADRTIHLFDGRVVDENAERVGSEGVA